MNEWAGAFALIAYFVLIGVLAWIFMHIDTEQQKTDREWNKRLMDYISGDDERPDE